MHHGSLLESLFVSSGTWGWVDDAWFLICRKSPSSEFLLEEIGDLLLQDEIHYLLSRQWMHNVGLGFSERTERLLLFLWAFQNVIIIVAEVLGFWKKSARRGKSHGDGEQAGSSDIISCCCSWWRLDGHCFLSWSSLEPTAELRTSSSGFWDCWWGKRSSCQAKEIRIAEMVQEHVQSSSTKIGRFSFLCRNLCMFNLPPAKIGEFSGLGFRA